MNIVATMTCNSTQQQPWIWEPDLDGYAGHDRINTEAFRLLPLDLFAHFKSLRLSLTSIQAVELVTFMHCSTPVELVLYVGWMM